MQHRQIALFGILSTSLLMTAFLLRSANAQDATFIDTTGERTVQYARLEIAGEDAILFLNGTTRFIEGIERRQEQPMEGNRNFWAVTPHQIYHLNGLAAEGWQVVGPTDPDSNTFLLVRGG